MEENPVADAEIIEKAVRGDTHAFRLLVTRYQKFVFVLAMRFLGNKADAEDILQEVFVRLWKNISTYRPEIKITTWLYTIVTNRCLDFLKSKQRRQDRITDSWDAHTQITDHDSPDRQFDEKEFTALVKTMSGALTPRQRAVFILRDLEELPVNEVCKILSMSAGNVKSNLYYARTRMSELLKKYYGNYNSKEI